MHKTSGLKSSGTEKRERQKERGGGGGREEIIINLFSDFCSDNIVTAVGKLM